MRGDSQLVPESSLTLPLQHGRFNPIDSSSNMAKNFQATFRGLPAFARFPRFVLREAQARDGFGRTNEIARYHPSALVFHSPTKTRRIEHHWFLIVRYCEDLIRVLREQQNAVNYLENGQAIDEAFYAGEVGQRLGQLASEISYWFTINTLDQESHFEQQSNLTALRTRYADDPGIRWPSCHMWMFLRREIFPRLLPEFSRSPRLGAYGRLIERSNSPFRTRAKIAGSQDCIAELCRLPGALIDRFELSVNRLAVATKVANKIKSSPIEQTRSDSESNSGEAEQPLPKVDIKLNQVRVGNECYNVTADAALLISEIVTSHPEPIAAYKLSRKPSRILKALPDPLRLLIGTKSGKGYWLKMGAKPDSVLDGSDKDSSKGSQK